MSKQNIRVKDTLIVGFALFAMFFGAGNLIFPPYLGVISGHEWATGFTGFLFADAGLSLLVIIVLTKYNGEMDLLFSRVGDTLAKIMGSAIVICIGPLIAVPRTAATSYEVGILPTIGPGFNRILFSIIFFTLVLLLTIKPSRVVDIVGQFLTPALLIALSILIIKGIIAPLGNIGAVQIDDQVFVKGVRDGYQTLDPLGAFVFASIIISSMLDRGYVEEKIKVKAAIMAGTIAAIGMALVYGGLAYIGATVSAQYTPEIDQTKLLVSVVEALLGGTGKILLAIVIVLACLTTAIGVTSAAGHFFNRLSKGKLSYEIVVATICILSAIISNFGVSQIIKFALPILLIIYPGALTIVILGIFGDKIKDDLVFKCATYVALIFSFIMVVADIAGVKSIVEFGGKLPFDKFGFNWILPVVIATIIGFLVSRGKKSKDLNVNININS